MTSTSDINGGGQARSIRLLSSRSMWLMASRCVLPVPRDSGRRTGNLHRPKRYSRRLRRVFYLSAQTSIIREGPNRDYYVKRAEGCQHVQAVIALARRRTDVLWALLRDDRPFTLHPPVAQTA